MRKYLITLTVLLAASFVQAKEYGTYNPKQALRVIETPAGKTYDFDVDYLDKMMRDLSLHARSYPTQFDTPKDKQRAIQDVKMLSGMLDVLVDVPNPNLDLLSRAGFLNSIGYNLDIAGSGEKTTSNFQRLLSLKPADPLGNYLYGQFLAGAGKSKEALLYLEKAFNLGVKDAEYAIAISYLSLGETDKALKKLESYKRSNPNNTNVDKIIDAIHNGIIEHKKS